MIQRAFALMFLLSLSVGVQVQNIDPPEVVVTLTTGERHKGEILSVRDQTIVFSTRHGAREKTLMENKEALHFMNLDDVKEVALPGTSRVWPGIALGMLAGCSAGYSIGSSGKASHDNGSGCDGLEQFSNGVAGCMGGGLLGAVAGGFIGGAASGKDIVLFGPNSRDPAILKSISRYQNAEPEFLNIPGQ